MVQQLFNMGDMQEIQAFVQMLCEQHDMVLIKIEGQIAELKHKQDQTGKTYRFDLKNGVFINE